MSGTHELNRLNDLSNFIAHLKSSQHADNASAQIAAKRLKKADGFAKVSETYLDDMFGEINWDPTEEDVANGEEEIRKITDLADRFEPDFELDTDEHAKWVQNAKGDSE